MFDQTLKREGNPQKAPPKYPIKSTIEKRKNPQKVLSTLHDMKTRSPHSHVVQPSSSYPQVRSDVTRFRYGDEQHLEEALKRIFRYGLVRDTHTHLRIMG